LAGASLFTLLDDIASVLDDVATMTKIAAKKTAGVLGDDLALNAEQVSGANPDRELPIVWAVAKGSLVNKLILVPSALALSVLAPWGVLPLLMVGGAYLCFEGMEKLFHHHDAGEPGHTAAVLPPAIDPLSVEKDKIKGAVRTDFVLSAEIIVIALGTVAEAPVAQRVAVLAGVGVLMTAGVYGLVAGIVKLDDLGLLLSRKGGARRAFGQGLLRFAPWLMKSLAIAGTVAMFLVGGGIVVHGLPGAHHIIESLALRLHAVPAVGGVLGWLTSPALNAVAGLVTGGVVLVGVSAAKRIGARKGE
jgi:predicted DNA repair protein MutK